MGVALWGFRIQGESVKQLEYLLSQSGMSARSKKWRFAFQTFNETPTTTPSTLGFGITHQPHEGGGWCEMWCEIRRHTLRHQGQGY